MIISKLSNLLFDQFSLDISVVTNILVVLKVINERQSCFYICKSGNMAPIVIATPHLEINVYQKVQKIFPLLAFCVILPTVDLVTDILLIKKLYTGGYRCRQSQDNNDFEKCNKDSVNYCTSGTANEDMCVYGNDPIYATTMFLPFLLNYLVSFNTWKRVCKNKMKTFIFPLFNFFPQYGKNLLK